MASDPVIRTPVRTPVRAPQTAAPAPPLEPSPSPDDEHVEPIGGVSYGLQVSRAVCEIRERTGLDEAALVAAMMRDSCAFFASEILSGPPEAPYHGRFLVAEHHEEWSELLCTHDRLCIEAARDHGKSGISGTLILRADGARIPVEQWQGGDVLAYNPETHRLEKDYAPASKELPPERCLRITTRTGRQIGVNAEHKFYKLGTWIRADELAIGDRIAVPRRIDCEATGEVEDAWLLGVLTGGGASADPLVIAELGKATARRGLALQERPGRPFEQCIKGRAPDGRVPPAIFTASNKTIAEFLSGLFDASAYVNLNGGGSVEFFCAREDAMRDVQHLLTRLGVVGVLAKRIGRYRGEQQESWRVTIRGPSLLRLHDVLCPRGKRRSEFDTLAADQAARDEGGSIDLLPCEAYGLVEHSENWFRRNGIRSYSRSYCLSRAKARTLADVEGNAALRALADAEILWDEVTEIEELGDLPVYGIKVERLQNYVANDIINHNTFFFDFAYPIWQAWKSPGGAGYIFSATQPQAERILDAIKMEIESNPRLQHLLPKKKDKWSGTAIRLANGHTIYARGFATRVRGAHPTWIVVDDGLNDETAYSETVRKKQADYFFNSISNMIVPGGQIIVVGCVTPDSWIATEQGLKQIGSLAETPEQTFLDCDLGVFGRDGMRRATKFWNNGPCDTKRVRLERGYTIEGSHRHPVLVMDPDGRTRWCRLDELEVGEWVGIHVGANVWGPPVDLRPFKAAHASDLPDTLTPDLAYLIGLWTAEGSFEGPPRSDSAAFRALIEHLGGVLGRASARTVPTAIMSADRAAARAFLQGLFDALGDVYARPEAFRVSIDAPSADLMRRVQQLLLNFGVLAALSEDAEHGVWTLHCHGADAAIYMREIGARLPQIQACAADGPPPVRDHGVPHQGAVIAGMRAEKPRRPRGAGLPVPPLNVAALAQLDCPSVASLETVLAWFEACGAAGLCTDLLRANLAEANRGRTWLRAESITDGHGLTLDFVVPDGHSFVANGLVNHNTPFHQNDLYALLERNEEYLFKRYQALSREGVPLWPERYSIERLERKRREIGSIRFTREFQCMPMADDMSLFPRVLFSGDVERFDKTLGMPADHWDKMGITTRFMGVDFAISANVEADYTVLWVMGVDRYGNRWIIDIERAKGLSYEAQKSRIYRMAKTYEVALIFLESNQMQRLFGEALIRETDLPIKQYQTGAEKHTLEKGIPSLRLLFENAKIRIPRGDLRSIELTDVWIDEMHNHTVQDGEVISIGEHDDTAMAFWICEQACRAGAFGFSFGEEAGDDEAFEELEEDDGAAGMFGEPEDYFAPEGESLILKPERQEKRGGRYANLVGKDDLDRDKWKPKDGAPSALKLLIGG